VHLFDRILSTTTAPSSSSRDTFGIVSAGASLYMSSSVTEVRKTNEHDKEDDMNVITLVAPPTKSKMPMFEASGPVMAIHSTQQFLHLLETAPKDGLVVIKYHAKFCTVCARVIIRFKKMAHNLNNQENPVPIIFAGVELTENAKIFSTLGIKKFPFLQIYRNTECIASFGTGPAHNFKRAAGGTIKDRLATTDAEWEKIRSDLSEEIANGQEKLRLLRLDIEVEEEFSDADVNISNTFPP